MDKNEIGCYGLIIGGTIGAIAIGVKAIKEVKETINFNPKLCSPFMAEFGPEAAKKKD